ncbi:carboxymuconolactone decarboxylase family protein [Segetibacter koreensis]|uniref:carboxymuconolactone decarboxylase family protein n=1 Tax=Segetibacter koreensis TaxID=398037 RepID=UPI0003728DAA|nr:carboxymuconolactone decarboxylase family protein [Segetibacter koreensis]
MLTGTAERFKLVSYEEASPKVRSIYDQTMQTLQLPFVLNWFKCQGNNATLLEGNWTKLRSTLLEGNVPNILKQLIIYNVSQERGCDYCAKAHGIFADSMSGLLSPDENFKVTDDLDSPVLPDSYKTAIKIVTKAAINTNQLTEEDFEELAKDGFTDEEIQELMAQADLVNMLNTIATISGIKVDNELLETEF